MEINRIHQLSEDVIGQIAAGEVVERPASAVKELVENAMDAGATSVSVEIKDGGTSFLRVTDNGKGINPQDIRLAFARHATSKIVNAADIYGVKTLGFRGEALASIAAVSRVQLVTRARGNETGVTAVNEGGFISSISDTACPDGTSITVRDLFYNAPVRLKFLRKPAFEAAAVGELMAALIISHPEISFRFKSDGKTVYFSAGDGTVESAVLCVFGLDVLKQLKKVDGSMSGLVLNGYVGVGELARGNRSRQYFFLNGRLMKSTLLAGALENACRQRVMIGRFPICMLYLTMPYENVDVNVHPNKWEVRFSDEKAVRSAVETLIFDVLNKQSVLDNTPSLFHPVPETSPAQPLPKAPASITVTNTVISDTVPEAEKKMPESRRLEPLSVIAPKQPSETVPSVTTPDKQPFVTAEKTPSADQNDAKASTAAGLLGLAELLKNAEEKRRSQPASAKESAPAFTGVTVPDRSLSPSFPKAEDRLTEPDPEKTKVFTGLREPHPAPEQISAFTVAPVSATFPSVRYIGAAFNTYILLEYQDRLLFCDQHAAHERLLYERLIRLSKENGSVSQELLVPLLITLSAGQYAVYEENRSLLRNAGFDTDDFGDMNIKLLGVPVILGTPGAERCFIDALDELTRTGSYSQQDKISKIMQTACKHAIKGGEPVSDLQLTALIKDILESKIPPTCPHGRPLFIDVTRHDLEKRFKRIQD